MLDLSQSGYGFGQGCCSCNVEASVTLDRKDVTLLEEFARLPYRVFVFHGLAVVGCEVNSWTALAARHGLGVESAVGRVSVFF